MTTKQVRETLAVDSVSKKGDVFTVRQGFFYTFGNSVDNLVAIVKMAFPTAEIVDSGEVWKPFNGGASVAQSSHWFVKFKV